MQHVLVVDDELEMRNVLVEDLANAGVSALGLPSADEAFEYIARDPVDVVVTDVRMRGMNGVDLCSRIMANRPDIPVIVITAFGNMETAVATLRAGAYDFLTKPFDNEELVLAVQRALQHRSLREEVKRLRDTVAQVDRYEAIIGESQAMRTVSELVTRMAQSDVGLLITGETGTGKDLVARTIHERSGRAKGPLVTLNCAALPESLLEGELFGQGKGAGAERMGLFLEAHGGTLVLDEIDEMPLAMQAKLLRVLEARRVRPLGGTGEIPFDVRLVAISKIDLATAVEEGRFRDDLFYRINVVRVPLPPLRSRGGDVLLLAQEFLRTFASRTRTPVTRLSTSVAERLISYEWPGNIRELKNSIERAVALARHDELIVEDLPEHIRNYSSSHVLVTATDASELVPLADVERRYIQRVLESVGGNKRRAAQILGLDRATLYRKLERFERLACSTSLKSSG